jgi:hypothetical protein
MMTFRRNGTLMKMPGYKQLIKSLINLHTPAYCVGCLEYLWSKRAATRTIMKDHKDVVYHKQALESDQVVHQNTYQPLSNLSFASVNASTSVIHGIAGPSSHQNESVEGEKHKDIEIVSSTCHHLAIVVG